MDSERDKKIIVSDAFSQLFDIEDKQSFFADGVAQCAFGPAVAKLSFFKVTHVEVRDGHSFETREIQFEVIIPSASLFQWIYNFIPQISEGIGDLEKANAQTLDVIKQVAKFAEK